MKQIVNISLLNAECRKKLVAILPAGSLIIVCGYLLEVIERREQRGYCDNCKEPEKLQITPNVVIKSKCPLRLCIKKTVEGKTCGDCYFRKTGNNRYGYREFCEIFPCMSKQRDDKKDVYFLYRGKVKETISFDIDYIVSDFDNRYIPEFLQLKTE